MTDNAQFGAVLAWVMAHDLEYQVHLNRTRFWIYEGSKACTEFLLLYADCCTQLDLQLDLDF